MLITKVTAERLKRGFTQVQFSYLSGVPVPEISKIETGRMQPYQKHATGLAKVLKARGTGTGRTGAEV